MRVALLSPCFWPEVRRGGERFTRELADGLIARGHEATLITSHPGPPRRTVEDGLTVLRLPRPPQRRLERRQYEQYLTHVPLSYAALKAGRYDVAHAVYPTDALAAARWGKRTGRPTVLTYLGIPDRKGLCERRKRLEVTQRAIRGCGRVVAISAHAAAAFERWLGYAAPVIAPGVDLDAFQPAAARSPHPVIVCAAAADVPRKHVSLLIDAFALLRRSHPDAELVLSGSHRDGLNGESRPGVRWTTLDDRQTLARVYAEAWVAALPASDEAFGLVLAEAMACGTPVVGYRHAAIPELIDDARVGRLFDALAPEPLGHALEEALSLARDPDTAAHCRARVSELSTDHMVERYLGLYRDLGAGGLERG